MEISCSDHGSPVLSSSETFPIIITDTNDHAPHFAQYEYMASISEGNELDVPVLQVDATDQVRKTIDQASIHGDTGSGNSEAVASELLSNFKEMIHCYW